jgi:TIR domain
MKAFLSHSSKDKTFVTRVANQLGPLQCEYDEYTFESTLNTVAIRRALKRCSLFVLFLSANSIQSTFIDEELRAALEGRAKGLIKQILIFSLDLTSYKALPEWLREINVVQRMSNYKACGRKIQATLTALDSETTKTELTYLGREEEEKALRKALTAAPGIAPIALHVVGHYGIGRRTFLRNSLSRNYPKLFSVFIEIPLHRYEGADELYRRGNYSPLST